MGTTRILIAEGDPTVLKMTAARLEHEGYDVITARDGEEALRAAEEAQPIHLILLGLTLPTRNGYEVCRLLKQGPATAAIPVIVLTATESHFESLADRCMQAGAADWVKKPFRTKDLLACVRRVLGEERPGHG